MQKAYVDQTTCVTTFLYTVELRIETLLHLSNLAYFAVSHVVSYHDHLLFHNTLYTHSSHLSHATCLPSIDAAFAPLWLQACLIAFSVS